MKVIALCGYPQVGKDSLAALLVQRNNFERVSFADPLRQALYDLNPVVALDRMIPGNSGFFCYLQTLVDTVGWEEAKRHYNVRQLLQRMGTEAGRNIHGPYCWTDIAEGKIDVAKEAGRDVVITDTRFDSEIEIVREYDENIIVHVHRPGYGAVNGHASEQMDYREMADVTIENDGEIEQLYDRLRAAVSVLREWDL